MVNLSDAAEILPH